MRIRKHANPLNCRIEHSKLQCKTLFPKAEQPLSVEFGCAHGEFILEMAKQHPQRNFIGFEVRHPLVEKVKRLIHHDQLENIYILYASSYNHITILPEGEVQQVYIFFPDPWFKKRHHKRRILTPKFFSDIRPKLHPDNRFLFQTDVNELYIDTLSYLTEFGDITLHYKEESTLTINETGIPSMYEMKHIQRKDPIYRICFTLHTD